MTARELDGLEPSELAQTTAREELKGATVSGVKWALASQVGVTVTQIGYSAAMSRLLKPQDFGVVAAVLVALRFIQYFTQLGLSAAIVQDDRVSLRESRTLHLISCTLGATLTAALVILSPKLAVLVVHSQHGGQIFGVFAFTIFLGCANLIPSGLLRRRHAYKQIAIIEFVSYIIGYPVIGVVCALSHLGPLSIALAAVSQVACQAVLMNGIVARELLRRPFGFEYSRRLMQFGGRLSVVSFVEFWSSNLDTFFVARWAGPYLAGQYTRGSYVVWLPAQQIGNVINRVMLSTFARLEDRRVGSSIATGLRYLSSVLFPLMTFASVVAGELVLVLLGPGWHQAAAILPVLAISATLNTLNALISVALEARALLKERLIVALTQLITLAGTMAIVVTHWKSALVLYACCWLVSESVRQVALIVIARSKCGLNVTLVIRHYTEALFLSAVAVAVGAGAYWILSWAGLPTALSFFVGGAAVLLTMGAVTFKIPASALSCGYREFTASRAGTA